MYYIIICIYIYIDITICYCILNSKIYVFLVLGQFLNRWSQIMSGSACDAWSLSISHSHMIPFPEFVPFLVKITCPGFFMVFRLVLIHLHSRGALYCFVRVSVAGYGFVPVVGRLHRWHMWCQLRTRGSAGRCHPASSSYARLVWLIDNLNYPQLSSTILNSFCYAWCHGATRSWPWTAKSKSKLKTWVWRIFNFLLWERDSICCQVASVRIANGADELLVLGTDGRK